MNNSVEIIFEEVDDDWGQKTGIITLHRGNALNALSFDMIHALLVCLERWQSDDSIKCVVIDSDSPGAFCAGGDIKVLYHARQKTGEVPNPFFLKEYKLNHLLYHYSKPYIALMGGIAMGGGLGVSIHGSHPVASDTLTLAMPEARIGFFVDIGSAHPLSRLPHHIGRWMALTGLTINAADAMALGLVKAVVPQSDFPSLCQALFHVDMRDNAHDVVDTVISNYAQPIGQSDLLKQGELIQACFCHDTVEEIIAAAVVHPHPWLQPTRDALAYNAPLSLHVNLKHLQRAHKRSFDEVICDDFNLVHHFLAGSDFMEGIRATVIDKDLRPAWQPATLADVDLADVSAYFEPIGPSLLD